MSNEIEAYKGLSKKDKAEIDIVYDVLAKFEEAGYEMDLNNSKSLALYDTDEQKRKKSYLTRFNEAKKLLNLSNPYLENNPYCKEQKELIPLPNPKHLISDMLGRVEDKQSCLMAIGRSRKSNIDFDKEFLDDFWFENYLK